MTRRSTATPEANRNATQAYRRLTWLYPPAFRREYGELLLAAFRARHARARRDGTLGWRLRLWRRIGRDLAVSLATEWLGTAATALRSAFSRSVAAARPEGGLAVRRLLAEPLGTGVSIATLGIAIAGVTAALPIARAALWTPLPYPGGEQLVRLWAEDEARGVSRFSFTVDEYERYREGIASADGLAGFFDVAVNLRAGERPGVRGVAQLATPGMLQLLGGEVLLGRLLHASDADETRSVAVISHAFWLREYDGDSAVVGQSLNVDGLAVTVVGVLTAQHRHPAIDVDVYVPHTRGTSHWTGRWLELVARIAPGATLADVESEALVAQNGAAASDAALDRWQPRVEFLRDSQLGEARAPTVAALAAIALLLACALFNIASLAWARIGARRRQLAIMSALGASRGRVAASWMAESVLLAVVGGVFGLAVSVYATRFLRRLGTSWAPRMEVTALTGFELLGAATAIVLLGVVAGATPIALRLGARRYPVAAARPWATLLGWRAMVATQVAVAVCLSTAATLVGSTLLARRSADPGFNPRSLIAVTVSLPSADYRGPTEQSPFFDSLETRMEAEGIEVALAADRPFGGRGSLALVNSRQRWRAGVFERRPAQERVVGGSFFERLGIELVAGRGFDRTTDSTTEAAIVSESLGRQLWPDGRAVGRWLSTSPGRTAPNWRRVVGVARDVQYGRPGDAPVPQVYWPRWQADRSSLSVFMRSADRLDAVDRLHAVVSELEPQAAVHSLEGLESAAARTRARWRHVVQLFVLTATLCIGLACAGLYALLNSSARARRHEVGVRRALGASAVAAQIEILRGGLVLVGVGTVAGMLSGRGLQLLMRAILAPDLVGGIAVYATTIVVVTLIAVTSCWGPARLARRIDPTLALRDS